MTINQLGVTCKTKLGEFLQNPELIKKHIANIVAKKATSTNLQSINVKAESAQEAMFSLLLVCYKR